MKPIELQIFFHTENTSRLNELGVRTDIAKTELRPMTFDNIKAISPYYEGGNDFCAIHTNGTEYICNMPYHSLKKILYHENLWRTKR